MSEACLFTFLLTCAVGMAEPIAPAQVAEDSATTYTYDRNQNVLIVQSGNRTAVYVMTVNGPGDLISSTVLRPDGVTNTSVYDKETGTVKITSSSGDFSVYEWDGQNMGDLLFEGKIKGDLEIREVEYRYDTDRNPTPIPVKPTEGPSVPIAPTAR